MNKKFVSLVAALSMVATMTAGFTSTVSAADVNGDSVVSVAETTTGVKLVNDVASNSSTTKVVLVQLPKYNGSLFVCDLGLNFPTDLVTNVAAELVQLKDDGGNDLAKSFDYDANTGKFFMSVTPTDGVTVSEGDVTYVKLTVTTNADVAFDISAYKLLVSMVPFANGDYDWDHYFDIEDCAPITLSVPKFESKPVITPITKAGTKVVRHTDGLDTPAEYWVAELDPATATFNTIKVVATDSTGATAEDTKTITTLTGDAVISVHIAILNATNEVSKVDVTASYVE